MRYDSYASPGELTLLNRARRRWLEHPGRRVATTEAVAAAVVLACGAALAIGATSSRSLSATSVLVILVSYLCAEQVRFPVGSAWTPPTQIIFVAALFILPTPLVPLVVVGCVVLSRLPQTPIREISPTLICARVGDSAYALAPAAILVAAHAQRFTWSNWPVYIAAFAGQVIVDASFGLGRTWFAERILPSEQMQMLWLYATDACLSCIGLLVAASAVVHPGLVLLTLPLFALLGMFARERQQRLDGMLELSTAYRGTALLLGDVVEGDHQYTGIHSRDVVDHSVAVADALRLDPQTRQQVEFAALLHDVGKLRVPKEIINKPGKLNEEEWAIMRRHTIDGEAMLKQVGGVLASVGRIVRASHEHFDGRGYPDGLAGEDIPIEARIVTACDAYSAMTTDRSYRKAIPVADAVAELRRCAGTQFDPAVVEALEQTLAPAPTTRGRVSVRRLTAFAASGH